MNEVIFGPTMPKIAVIPTTQCVMNHESEDMNGRITLFQFRLVLNLFHQQAPKFFGILNGFKIRGKPKKEAFALKTS